MAKPRSVHLALCAKTTLHEDPLTTHRLLPIFFSFYFFFSLFTIKVFRQPTVPSKRTAFAAGPKHHLNEISPFRTQGAEASAC